MSKVQHFVVIGTVFIASAIMGGPAAADIGRDMEGGIGANPAFEELLFFKGGAGNDTLTGTDGDDGLDGLDGNDTLSGLKGDDFLYGGDGADKLYGGDGNDILFGADQMSPDSIGDEFYGGSGGDTLFAGNGPDKIFGGADGFGVGDTVNYGDSPTGVTVNLSTGRGYGGYAEGDTIDGVEIVIGSGSNDVLIGNDAVNRLDGGNGNDVLIGGGGDDTLVASSGDDALLGGAGADIVDGGFGSDTFRFASASDSSSNSWTYVDQILNFYTSNVSGEQDKLAFAFMTVGKVTSFASVTALDGATLAANEVGYAVAGSNTYVRVGADNSFRLKLDNYSGGLSLSHFVP